MKKYRKGTNTSIKADVIILGCTLPGIVTAHKLKKKFGDTMDIVVLDIAGASKVISKCNVAFKAQSKCSIDEEEDNPNSNSDFCVTELKNYEPSLVILDTVDKHYLIKYTNEFRIPIPSSIINPMENESTLNKLFQYRNGKFVSCNTHFTDFNYLSYVEKFELNQYQTFLDKSMKRLFQKNTFVDPKERQRLLYYDQTTMEKNICDALLFPTSRAIMRTTVQLVCGASANTVSLLFYLHQCYRTCGAKNHLGGQNTRFREKLVGYCRIRLSTQLQESVADITLPAKSIKNIRSCSNADVEQIIIENKLGDTTYICTLLAMALKPDQLQAIEVDNQLLPDKEAYLIKGLTSGKAKKFLIQYEAPFWQEQGYSGDIFSTRGPIMWAMERPQLSFTGSVQKYASLNGYLMVRNDEMDSKVAVVEQLTNLFGEAAANPVSYRETSIVDIFVPRCGDYVGLRLLTNEVSPRGVEWGAFDVFGDGDVAASLQAGHMAYLHLVSCLRPQAQTYEDISASDWPTLLAEPPFSWWLTHINVVNSLKLTIYTTFLIVGLKLLRSYLKK